ncbi:MAG: 4Fe-4S binding protein [Chloroflexi bacterium]|nr:4Fe-4S binding protein [Chloroflexota bacterium]
MRKFNTKYESSWSSYEFLTTLDTGSWRSERPVVDAAKCRQCGWCYLYCPVGCIDNIDGKFVPNLKWCKGCGVCVKECPVAAIKMVTEEVV